MFGVGCGIIGVYLIVEYWWLKKEDLDLPFSAITGVAVNEKKNLVAITFEGHKWCSPAVLKSASFKEVAASLRSVLPSTQAQDKGRRSSAGLAYYCGLLSVCLPFVGLILGIIALVVGLDRLEQLKEDPSIGEKGRTWAGVIGGGLGFMIWLGATVFLVLRFIAL